MGDAVISAIEGETPSSRAGSLFAEARLRLHARTDRMFAGLMAVQWAVGVLIALWLTPQTWIGRTSEIHLHAWAAVVLGGLIASLPIALAVLRPGGVVTRHVIAVGQWRCPPCSST